VADSPESFIARRLNPFLDELEGRKLKELADKMGVRAKALAKEAASADLGGDNVFSGWPKAPLDTRYDHLSPGTIGFKPTRRAAGPWTTAQYGRNQAAGPRMVGPRLTKTGRVSKAKTKRWNGKTAPKNTATEALELIEREMPKVVDAEVNKAIRKFFN
jgi:hypothetical protein